MIDPRWPLVVDISDHQGEIPDDEVERWLANRVAGSILRAHSEEYCVVRAQQFRSHGLGVVGTYLQPEWLRPAGGIPESYFTVDSLVRRCNQLQIETAIIDNEWSNPELNSGIAYQMILAAVDRLRAEGLKPVNYTGEGWWRAVMGDWRLPDCPLWHAAYWNDYRAVQAVGYGGGAQLWMHQFTSTPPDPFRDHLDLSYAYVDLEEPMTPEEKAAFQLLKSNYDRLSRVVAGWGIVVDETGEELQ